MDAVAGVVVSSVGRGMVCAALEECQTLLQYVGQLPNSKRTKVNKELYALDLDVTVSTAIALMLDLKKYRDVCNQSVACKTCLHALNDSVFQIKDTLFQLHYTLDNTTFWGRLTYETPAHTIVEKLAVQKAVLKERMDRLCQVLPVLVSVSKFVPDEPEEEEILCNGDITTTELTSV